MSDGKASSTMDFSKSSQSELTAGTERCPLSRAGVAKCGICLSIRSLNIDVRHLSAEAKKPMATDIGSIRMCRRS